MFKMYILQQELPAKLSSGSHGFIDSKTMSDVAYVRDLKAAIKLQLVSAKNVHFFTANDTAVLKMLSLCDQFSKATGCVIQAWDKKCIYIYETCHQIIRKLLHCWVYI
jgi:hypothetical protein